MGTPGLGFAVWGLDFGVEDLVLRVEDLGFGVWGLRDEVGSSGLRVEVLGMESEVRG